MKNDIHCVNPIYQKIYDTLLFSEFKYISGKIYRRILKCLELFILNGKQLFVRYNLEGKRIVIPWTHNLPVALKDTPQYSHNTARIGRYISGRNKKFTFIDIGANIGDTALLQRSEARYPVLCIEGDDLFYSLLKNNTASEQNVVCIKAYVGDEDSILHGTINKYLGSGNISISGEGDEIVFKSLETILADNPLFKKSKMLKIDTDGYDLKILRGAKKFLKNAKPVIFFEYDPCYFKQNKEDGLSIFSMLFGLGYKNILIYDNIGDLLLSGEISNKTMLEDIHEYYSGRQGRSYCDLCVFHRTDAKLFAEIRSKELDYYQSMRGK